MAIKQIIMKTLSVETAAILDVLDEVTKQRVIDTLTAYDRVLIDYSNGKYHIGALCLLDKYPADFRQIGYIYNHDVYTEEEMAYNYSQL